VFPLDFEVRIKKITSPKIRPMTEIPTYGYDKSPSKHPQKTPPTWLPPPTIATSHHCPLRFRHAEIVGTLKNGYIRKVPLPRVPRVQSTSPVACATIHRNTAHTGYLPIARIPTWSNLLGSLSGLGRCIERYIPPFLPVRLM
jgi:hypothetical protein